MSKIINIRGLELGAKDPKICVPLTGGTKEALLKEVALAKAACADLVEWRVDYFEQAESIGQTREMAFVMREALGEIPLLFTYRTEDGVHQIAVEDYIKLNKELSATGALDLIDVELFMGDRVCKELISCAHENGVKVIISNHDFGGTPPRQQIVERLARMRKLGADIPKIALMPDNPADVLELLAATYEFSSKFADCPIITMSMKWLGCLSRVCGVFFGSAVTFGATDQTSAPGQLATLDVRSIIKILSSKNEMLGEMI